jgi:hypothetical protein
MSTVQSFNHKQPPLLLSPKLRITKESLLAFIFGATSSISFMGVGQIFLVEVLLLIFAYLKILTIFAFRLSVGKKILSFKYLLKFIIVLNISFLGYVISDLFVGSAPSDYLRGWAKLVFLITNVSGLMLICLPNPWHLWWFGLGNNLCGILFLIFSGAGGISLLNWKMGYGGPLSALIFLLLPLFGRHVAVIGGIIIGLVNIFLDYRSLGVSYLLVAAIIFVKDRHFSRQDIVRASLGLGITLFLLIYTYNQTQTFTYSTGGQTYETRRLESNTGRTAGLELGIIAISESPIVGYGSWAKNTRLGRIYDEIALQDLKEARHIPPTFAKIRTEDIPVHSQILQSWVEGGILGVVFFVFFAYELLVVIKYCCLDRPYDRLLPFFLISLLPGSLWDLLFSPFAGAHRLSIASSVVLICILHAERQVKYLKRA